MVVVLNTNKVYPIVFLKRAKLFQLRKLCHLALQCIECPEERSGKGQHPLCAMLERWQLSHDLGSYPLSQCTYQRVAM